MSRHVLLLQFTDKGVNSVRDSPTRAEAFRNAAVKMGATIDVQLWTEGKYDGVVVFSAPDEKTACALALELGRLGNVRTCLMRGYSANEFKEIVAKIG